MSDRYRQIKIDYSSKGELYCDPEFPAHFTSLDPSGKSAQFAGVRWKRPKEICPNPCMFEDDCSTLDIVQGVLGDCWVLAALASLTLDKQQLKQVVPQDQVFNDPDYCGVFRFNFWRYGQWKEVIIDDRLPVRDNQLLFVHSASRNEMWSALLEKAYAKLFRSYFALRGGQISEALVDFTGGIVEEIGIEKSDEEDYFRKIEVAIKQKNLVGCTIDATSASAVNKELKNGLVMGHAYSVTNTGRVRYQGQKVCLLRIRNPWGNEKEWNGPWGDGRPEWNKLSYIDRKSLSNINREDGEFWMCYEDFEREFSKLVFCHKVKSVVDDDKNIKAFSHNGSWIRGLTAGGCRNFIDTFARNPQYRVTLSSGAKSDRDPKCTLIVSLMQKNFRGLGPEVNSLSIGFAVYCLDEKASKMERLDTRFFETNKMTDKSDKFLTSRGNTKMMELNPGNYCVVVSTFEPNVAGDFYLRILAEDASDEKTSIFSNIRMPKLRRQSTFSRREDEMTATVNEVFEKSCDRTSAISPRSMKELLKQLQMDYKEDTLGFCRALFALFDYDSNGKLDYHEFMNSWRFVLQLKDTFDRNSEAHKLSAMGIHSALVSMDIKCPNKVLATINERYADSQKLFSFAAFGEIVCKIKAICEVLDVGFPLNRVRAVTLERALCAALKF